MPVAAPGAARLFADVCLPIFVLIGLGWVLERRFALQLRTLVKLNIYCFVPCFIFVAVVESPLSGAFSARIILFTLVIIAAMGLLSWLTGRIFRLPEGTVRSLQLSTMFYNCGNYGLPLMALAFPATGPAVQVFVLMTMNITTFSLGTFLVAGGRAAGHGSSRRGRLGLIARQPSIYAISAALLARQLPVPLTEIPALWRPLDYVHDGLVSMALLTLGVQLAKSRPAPLRGLVAWALLQRLAVAPLLAALLAPRLGFPPGIVPVLILGAATPTAVNVALLAHEFEADAPFASTMVFYTTLASMITVTAILWILRWQGAGL